MFCKVKRLSKEILVFVLVCVLGTTVGHLYSNDLYPYDVFFSEYSPQNGNSFMKQLVKIKNMTCGELGIDQSCIIIQSNVERKIQFMYQSMECDNCTLLKLKPLDPHHVQKVVFNLSSFGTEWKVLDYEDNLTFCNLSRNYFGENSWYHLQVNETGCTVVCDKEPENVFLPILIAFGFSFLFAVFWFLGRLVHRSVFFNRIINRNSLEDLAAAFSSASGSTEETNPKPTNKRLQSLDVVRGIAIGVMIFVNYGGGKYTFFHHARWNGLTVADLVFPWFIWMMGMSMAFSMKSQMRKVVSKEKIFFKIVKRSIILFSLGLMLNTICLNVDVHEIRIPGVLQRFSISYFVVATVHLFYASADNESDPNSHWRDITAYGGEWLIMLMCLMTHLLLVFLVHSPECPKGYMGPGGLHDQSAYSSCTGGAAGYIDRMILGSSHIYQHPSSKVIYHSKVPHDPEGILGCFTSIFLVFLGLQAGKILLIYKDHVSRIIRWSSWATLTGLTAGILCCFSKNDGWIPVNKNLWSVSFILTTGSLAFILLSICYYVVDVKKWWNGAPFYQAGMNSILLYVGHELTHNMFPWKFQVPANHLSQLFVDLWGTFLWVVIAVWMHHKGEFITI